MTDCCYRRSCPAPVSTVNVTNVSISMTSGDGSIFKQETLTLVALADGYIWLGNTYTHKAVLTDIPYTDESLSIYINGIHQRSGTDYARDGYTVYFNFPSDARPSDMSVVAVYYGVDYTIAPATGVGMIQGWSMSAGSVPAGWLVCDGSAVSRTVYGALFDVIDTTYGVGDGSTTFNLPKVTMVYRNPTTGLDETGPAIIKY